MVTRNNRGAKADLIFGATKTRKTSMIAELAEYVWEKTGKQTRVVHLDLGGFAPLEAHIEAGMIDIWPVGSEPDLLLALDFAAQGYWPDKAGKYTKDGLDKIGGYAFEGITSFGDGIYSYYKEKGIRLNTDAMFKYSIDDAMVKDLLPAGTKAIEYRGGSQGHIYEAQTRTVDLIGKSSMLPVEKVLWTALETLGTDFDKSPVYGPQCVGKALTGKFGQMFGNFLHMEQLVTEGLADAKTKQVKLDTRPVMYLKPHAHPLTKIPFHAGTRALPMFAAELPEYLDPPSLGQLYRKLDEFKAKGKLAIMDKIQQSRTAEVAATSTK